MLGIFIQFVSLGTVNKVLMSDNFGSTFDPKI